MNLFTRLDFDGSPRRLVEAAYNSAWDVQQAYHQQYLRDHNLYNAVIDLSERDSTLPQIHIPRIYQLVEDKAPEQVKALLGSRPYIPFEAVREEFREISEIQSEYVDDLLQRGNFWGECTNVIKWKTLYGTSFMEVIPEYATVTEKSVVFDSMGGWRIQKRPVQRLRFSLRAYAPWEVLADPFARNLETTEGCRYIVKLKLVSVREMKRMAEAGTGYTNFDFDQIGYQGSIDGDYPSNFGWQILQDYGLPTPSADSDIRVSVCYESPERYIEMLDGKVTARDGDNPYSKDLDGHGEINLARMIHTTSAHPASQFWAHGEAKPNEVFEAMLSDQWVSIFRHLQFVSEPLVFYRNGSEGIDVDDLIWDTNNRIPVNTPRGRPIADDFYIHSGGELGRSEFDIVDRIERYMDVTAQNQKPSRGEAVGGGITATEYNGARAAGNARQELTIKTAELFLDRLGKLCAGHATQFGEFVDFEEVVGTEKAQLLFTANPGDLPGGYNIRFQGSNSVMNKILRRQDMMTLTKPITELLAKGHVTMARRLMEEFDMPKHDIDSIIQESQTGQLQAMMGAIGGGQIPNGGFPGKQQALIAQGAT